MVYVYIVYVIKMVVSIVLCLHVFNTRLLYDSPGKSNATFKTNRAHKIDNNICAKSHKKFRQIEMQ